MFLEDQMAAVRRAQVDGNEGAAWKRWDEKTGIVKAEEIPEFISEEWCQSIKIMLSQRPPDCDKKIEQELNVAHQAVLKHLKRTQPDLYDTVKDRSHATQHRENVGLDIFLDATEF